MNFNQFYHRLFILIYKDCEEPYCVIELDNPIQKQITNVFKDSSVLNEQFLFDVANYSEELAFSIYDRSKDYGSE